MTLKASFTRTQAHTLTRVIPATIAVGLLALACSGSESTAPTPAPVASVSFGTAFDSVVVGQTRQLSIVASDANHRRVAGRAVVWSVNDSTIATVTSGGLVTGLALGTTRITARTEGVSASLAFLVRTVPVAMVTFPVTAESLLVGDSATVSVIVKDASGTVLTDRLIAYSSLTPSVLSVTPDGAIRALTSGTATVVARSEGRVANLTVVIKALPLESLRVTPAKLDLATSVSGLLTARGRDTRGNVVIPPQVVFHSDNPAVLTVEPTSGQFLTHSPGTAIITATSGNITGRVPVAVQSLQPGTFHFDLRFVGPPDADMEAAARAAAARWERVLPLALAAQAVHLDSAQCETLAPAISGTTTGIIVTVAKDKIDGRSNTLAEAGPCVLRSDNAFPAAGVVSIDSADVQSMVRNGSFVNVIAHELGHVLGIGTLWNDPSRPDLVTATTGNDPRYVGAGPVRAAIDIGFLGADSSRGVEVENVGGAGSAGSHWRESVYNTELMTSIDGPGNSGPLSIITVGSLHDLGYVTRDAGADFFTVPLSRLGPSPFSNGVSGSLAVPLRPSGQREILRFPQFRATPSGELIPLRPKNGAAQPKL